MILIFETNKYFSFYLFIQLYILAFYSSVKMKFGRLLKPLIINDDPISIDRGYNLEQNGR